MTIGKKIKIIREFRAMTQKELGLALGYPEKSAAIRIAQYESNTRVPKINTIIEISKILKCNYSAIYNEVYSSVDHILHELFWLEETIGSSFHIFKLERYYDTDDNIVMSGKYNDYNYMGSYSPIAISIGYNLLNDFMSEWAIRHHEYISKKITREEYFEWKINWPNTCDDNGKPEPTIKWRKN